MSFLKRNFLLFVVFITGAAVLVVEVVAIRILAPYFGNTIFSVSSILGVILAALSVGYYIGGTLADKHPSLKWFFGIILASGISIFILQFLIMFVLPFLSRSFSIIYGPLVSSIVLFFIPSFLLGTLSPFAIKLQEALSPNVGIGTISGKIFFWSTFGSIFGSLFSGFVLIPNFGLWQIMVGTGLVLVFMSIFALIVLNIKKGIIFGVIFSVFVMFLMIALFQSFYFKENVVYAKDGIYGKIIIMDVIYENRPARLFIQDRSLWGGVFLDSEDHAFEYSKYYSLYRITNPEMKRALVIGGGIYTIPKSIAQELPNAIVDVVEIEPSFFDLAKEFFGLKDYANLNNFIQDGRRFLADSENKYDLIYGDAYSSLFSVPSHLTTIEFFEVVRDKLNNDGIFIANIIGNLNPAPLSLLFSEMKTFRTVFPNSYFFAVDSKEKIKAQNIIFVGYKGDDKIDFLDERIAGKLAPLIVDLDKKMIDTDKIDFSRYMELTDNFCPVDYLTAQTLKNQKF
ncbi:fused MFS/spermidine synthase [Patescibacteria group bacterium]|nr:fused MFS/spermidine synthase [Patescibacteria group bacterium]MBU4162375.1 fused MFS/spermidine synthase [Patescibacteria group bacterium]